MRTLATRFLLTLLCSLLPVFASATTSPTITAEWSSYTPPAGLTVTAFKLYQDGVFACQTTEPAATTMDCQVTLIGDTTNFTLTAQLSDGTESAHSAPIPYTLTASSDNTSGTTDDTTTDTTAPEELQIGDEMDSSM